MARPVSLLLAATLATSAIMALLALTGTSGSTSHATTSNSPPTTDSACAATIDDWMISSTWPTDEILIGDQLYGRARLFNLASSKGNVVADLALAMAAVQLNLAAGAEPSADVLEALFQADGWLLDGSGSAQRSQQNYSEIRNLISTLADFNDWAATASECAPTGSALAMR